MKLEVLTKTNCLVGALICAVLAAGFFSPGHSQIPMPADVAAGFTLIDQGKLDTAELLFKKMCERNKKDVWALTGLGAVYLRRGETTTQAFEILLKLFKQDNTSRAIGKFKEALKLQPEFLDARYYLGRALINKRSADKYAEAANELSTVAQRDSLFRDTIYQLGLAHLGMEKWKLAIADFQNALRLLPDDRRPAVKKSDALFELDDAAQASETFLENIGLVRDEEFLKDVFEPMRPLCSKSEKDEFEDLPVAEKGTFIRRFWRKRNPTPGTVANERLHEHYRRLKFVLDNFHMPMKPYYDDRGKVYLRYGKPQQRFVSPVYLGNVKSNESWSYENIQENLLFDFVEEGGIFKEVDDLSQAAGTGLSLVNRYAVAADLYAERADMSLLYTRMGMMTYVNVGDLTSRISEVSAAKNAAQARATREKYLHDYKARPLEFAFNWAGFRGDAGKTDKEIYFGIPASRLRFRRQGDQSLMSHLECAVVIEDSVYDEVMKSAWSTQFVADDSSLIEKGYQLFQRDVALAPGSYNVTLQIANPDGNSLGIYQTPLHVRSFAGEALMLSDIEFAFTVQPASGSADFVKHDLAVRPYPFDSLQRSRPIYLYYEVYNLTTDAENRHDYRVEYEARVLRQSRSFFKSIASIFGGGKKRGVSSSYQRQGVGQVAYEYIALDLGNLPKGLIEIAIRVTDTRTGRTAETARNLSLEE